MRVINKKKIAVIVIDSVGVGAMEDAIKYGDEKADTLGHIDEVTGGIVLPNMQKLGLYNIKKLTGMEGISEPLASFGKIAEKSNGKDTLTGHWEMMGVYTTTPFKTFTDTGFPKELMDELTEKTGHKFIGNYSASGTGILEELGKEHEETKALIVYTSADSVLQIAANEEIIPLEELYRVCEIAREITLAEEYRIGRIIARPFLSKNGEYTRTPNRHDYAIEPPHETVLDKLKNNGYDVISIGKINDIFSGCGITKKISSKSNHDGMEKTISVIKNEDFNGLLFVNLVDFDSLYGHRRDTAGYGKCLEEFDGQLGELLKAIDDDGDTCLIITADHGNDPTMPGSDHTREHVPVLIYDKEHRKNLGVLNSFADLGATILDNFNIENEFEIGEKISLQ